MTDTSAARATRRPGPRGGGADGTGRAPEDRERLASPGFAYGAQTWREIAHLLANLPLGVAGFAYVSVWLYAGAALSVTVIGLPVLALGLLGARQFGKLERARARVLLALPVEEPSPIRGRAHGGFFPWLWSSLKDPVGWRTVLYSLIRLPWGVLTFTVTLVSLFAAWPVLGWTARALTHGDRAMVRGLLSPSDELERRIAELESG
ncbi:sensor histidine kinase, partial [Streptomyces sp. SID5475]|nr:sensor histidine kinase [Streptomyces sp. SID5475]